MTVQLSTLGRHFIEAWEGCILGAYDDDNDDRIHHHSSMLDALNAGNFDLADHDFMLYDRANGVVLAGLEDRRAAERDLFHMGVYRGPSDEQIT